MTYLSFLNFSEEVSSNASLSEKLQSFLTSGVAGYVLVFTVLGLIWLILEIFGRAFTKKPEEESTEIIIEAQKTTVPEPQPVIEKSSDDDAAIVAAIVAAISAYTNKPANGFRVVSFKKK